MQLKKALEIQNMASTITNFAPLQIPLEDIVKATNNFHQDNIIGHDDFGRIYKGRLLGSGSLMWIAAQRFDGKHKEGDLAFLARISALSDLEHTNLVSIIGFCYEKDEKIIIITYEANGSLELHLNSLNLTWTQRLIICNGMADVLSYLHYDEGRDYGIIHCNINSGTVLLDNNWEAKLSGFETSIKQLVCYKDQVFLCEHIGKMGYTDPAIEKTGGVTHKSDIYSFGVVLCELLCGREAFIENDANRFLAPMVDYHHKNITLYDIVPPYLSNQMSMESFIEYSNLAHSCLNEDHAHRPDMNYIVSQLEKALELQLHYEFVGKNLRHLKVSLDYIKSVTHDFSDTYKFDSYDNVSWYRVELDHFDKQNLLFIKGKNEGEQPKVHNTVIIRRYPSGRQIYREELFFREVERLSLVNHPNIITILGFCVEGSEKILVIENVSNGYLGSYLQKVKDIRILTWEKRLNICIDVAHALNYLHFEMDDQVKIINRDISSYGIGLDEKWGAKIMDFGSSVFLLPFEEDNDLFVVWKGKPSYVDPEHKLTSKLKRESDVYGFGVVLFEILCGRIAYDPIYKKGSDKGLAYVARKHYSNGTLKEMIDPIVEETSNDESLQTFIEIAYQCVAETQDQRPTMKVVAKELEKALLLFR